MQLVPPKRVVVAIRLSSLVASSSASRRRAGGLALTVTRSHPLLAEALEIGDRTGAALIRCEAEHYGLTAREG